MFDGRYETLIHELLVGTKTGNIVWTSRLNEQMTLVLNQTSIILEQNTDGTAFRLVGPKGRVLESFFLKHVPDDFGDTEAAKNLSELFSEARRQVLNVDQHLDSTLALVHEAAKGQKKIGSSIPF
jgi:hypothetical protein